jgi:hypothetical protein
MISSLFFVDPIPVNEGRGWDGNLFYSIITDWGNGSMGAASEPYRFMRMGSFLPLVVVQSVFEDENVTMICARILAIGLSFSSILLVCFAAMRTRSIKCVFIRGQLRENEYLWVMLLSALASLNHAIFTMPSHYPLLSDHMALFIAGASIYIWSGAASTGRYLKLSALATYGFFVMPLVSLVPLVLLAGPRAFNDEARGFIKQNSIKYERVAIVVLSVVMAVIALIVMSTNLNLIGDDLLISRGGSCTSPAIIDLKKCSLFGLYATAGVMCYLISTFFVKAIKSISIKGIAFGVGAIFLAAMIMFSVPDWSKGMGGPRLLVNILMQGLHSPQIGLISFFSYFGPMGVLALLSIGLVVISKVRVVSGFESIFFIASLFLFPALIGNETRQFIAVYPVLIFILLTHMRFDYRVLFVTVVFAFFTLIIGWPISANVSRAMGSGADFLDPKWQAYFGRQGPWMSTSSIILYQSIALVFLSCICLASFPSAKDDSSENK